MRSFLPFLMCALGLAGSWSWAAERIEAPHVTVSLISPDRLLEKNRSALIGFRFQMEPHWHVYWKNPGDSGAAPKFQIEVQGGHAGPVLWPIPKRLPLGDLVNLGYEGEVVLPLELQVAAGEDVKVTAKLEWLVCREECVPGFATLEKSWPTEGTKQPDAIASALLTQALKQVPAVQPANDVLGGRLRGQERSPESYELTFEHNEATAKRWDVFPVDGGKFLPQPPVSQEDGKKLHWTFKTQGAAPPGSPAFVIVDLKNPGSAAEVIVTPVTESLWSLWVFALVGGMILNLMPCVFPVLSIKVFSLIKESGGHRGALAREGFLYTAGVLISFLFLGALFLLLRHGGEAIGWGFQLQSPAVVYGLGLLFFVLALNFLGVFEWGMGVMNWAGLQSTTRAGMSAFGTGVLSVFVAAPCTGPFMGAALGAAATLPAFEAMTLFLALGIGLALPVLSLCLSPGGLKVLPKPGAWMNTLKEFFAFPLFATVLWLLWVLVQQVGEQGVLVAGGALLLMALALWLKGRGWIRVLRVLLIIGVILLPPFLLKDKGAADSSVGGTQLWSAYEETALREARAQGRPVFVDFTAAWCITCQWNKKTVLRTDAGTKLFQDNNVLLLEGDWTRYDEKITKALAAFGRASVPLYVYYPPNQGEPKVLPQILSLSMIEELFSKSTGGQKK